MYIMSRKPAQGLTATEIERHFADKHSPQDLADAYAITHNQFWWTEDTRYDFEVTSPEYKAASKVTDEWHRLMKQYQEQIFDILRSEGSDIPSTGQIIVLTPFMKKYGYEDHGGWWVKNIAETNSL